MIKKNSKLILGIIIGLIISIGGVYATGTITANQVTIDKTNGKLANITGDKVQDALDYLHAQASKIGSCPEGYTCNIMTNPGYLPENDSTTYTQSTFVQNLKVGDLIKVTPIVASIKLNGNKSGIPIYNTTATYLNPSELEYWRVIRKNTRPWTASTSSSTTAANEALGAGDMAYETDYNLVVNAYKNTTIGGTSGTAIAYQVGTTTAACPVDSIDETMCWRNIR